MINLEQKAGDGEAKQEQEIIRQVVVEGGQDINGM